MTLSLCASSSYADGGIRKKQILLSASEWDCISIDITDEEYQYIHKWIDSHIGLKYDVLGLFGFIFRPIDDDRNKFFCSEAVAGMLGIPEGWRFDPNTLFAFLSSNLVKK